MIRDSSVPSDPSTPSVGLRLARGSVYTFATSMAGRGFSVIQSILVARILGVTNLGVLALLGVVSSIVSLFSSFAMDTSVIKMISPARDSPTTLARITSTFLVTSIGLAVPFSIGLILSSPLFAAAFKEPQLGPLLVVAGANLGLAAVLRVFPTLLQSLERIELLSRVNLLVGGFALVSTVALAVLWGLFGVVAAQLATTAVGLVLHLGLRRSAGLSLENYFTFDWRIFRDIVTLSAPQLVIAVIETLGYSVGPTLVAAVRGFSELGLLRVDQTTSMLLLLIPTSVIVPFLPAASRSYEKDPAEFDRIFLRSSKYTLLMVLPFSFALTAFPAEILSVLYSQQYAPAASAMPLFAGSAVALSYASVSGWIFLISRSLRRMIGLYLVSFGLLTILNLTLVPVLGFWGAGLATLLTAVPNVGISWLLIRPVYSRHGHLSAVASLLSMTVAFSGLILLSFSLDSRVVTFAASIALAALVTRKVLSVEDKRFLRQIPRRILFGDQNAKRGLRVLVFSPRFYPAGGGVEKHVLRTAQEMLRVGHEVLVVTEAHSTDLASEESAAGVPVYRIRARGRIPIFVELVSLLPRILRSDVVHCHDFVTFYYWYLPFRLLLPWKKTFVTFHGYEEYPPPQWAVWRRRLVSLFATESFCIGKLIEKSYGTPCNHVLIGGVDSEKYRDVNVGDKELRAVFLGRLEPDTGIDMFVRAVHLFQNSSGAKLPVDVCGSGRQLTAARSVAAELGVEMVFHGWVEDPAPFLVRSSFVFASGYLTGLEAMAAGCITIFAATSSAREDVMKDLPGPPGAVWVCRTPEDIARVIANVLANSDLRANVGRAAHELVMPITWHAVASEYLQAYGA